MEFGYKNILAILSVFILSVIVGAVLALGNGSWDKGYKLPKKINGNQGKIFIGDLSYDKGNGYGYKVENDSDNYNYFIPTKASDEWTSFKANKPSDVTITKLNTCGVPWTKTNIFLETFGTGGRTTTPYQSGWTYTSGDPGSDCHTDTKSCYNISHDWFADHTPGDTNGRHFTGDPARTKAGQIIYKRTINVEKNKKYRLSYWGNAGSYPGFDIKVTIYDRNGSKIKDKQQPRVPSDNKWHEYWLDFNSGNNNKITFELKSTRVQSIGNDPAVDDISVDELTCVY